MVGWLAQLDEKERPDLVKRALKVGIVALSTTFIGNTGEMLKQSLERWRAEMENALNQTREQIVSTISERFGHQVVQPVRDEIERATKDAVERIKERVREVEQRIDPSDPQSWLGITQNFLEEIRREFDPNRQGSYLWLVRNTLSEFYGRDGEAARCISDAIKQSIEPLQSLAENIRQDIVEIKTRLGGMRTEAGLAFEREAVGQLLKRATAVTGDSCEHVGRGGGAGDWIVEVRYGSTQNRQTIGRIVIEAKDATGYSPQRAKRELIEAMSNRKEDIGILIFARRDQNPFDLPFTVLDDNYSQMVCVWDEDGLNFNFAYQLARLCILENYLRATAQVDWADLRHQVQEIIAEAERMDELTNKARLAKERAEEAEKLSNEIKRNLLRRLQRLQNDLSRA